MPTTEDSTDLGLLAMIEFAEEGNHEAALHLAEMIEAAGKESSSKPVS